eukprot:scaffold27899_cov66-Phaeocystis_antarctica.AAC.2
MASDAGKGVRPSPAAGGVAAAGGAAAAALAASLSAFSAVSASRTSLLPAPRSGCCSRSLASSGLGPSPGSASHSPRTASRRPSAMRRRPRRTLSRGRALLALNFAEQPSRARVVRGGLLAPALSMMLLALPHLGDVIVGNSGDGNLLLRPPTTARLE